MCTYVICVYTYVGMCRGQRTGQPWVQTSPSTSFETRSLFLFTAACTRLAGIFPVSGAHLPVSALELQMHMLPHLAFKWLLGDLDSCLPSQQFLYPLRGSHFPRLSPGFLHDSCQSFPTIVLFSQNICCFSPLEISLSALFIS